MSKKRRSSGGRVKVRGYSVKGHTRKKPRRRIGKRSRFSIP